MIPQPQRGNKSAYESIVHLGNPSLGRETVTDRVIYMRISENNMRPTEGISMDKSTPKYLPSFFFTPILFAQLPTT